MHLNDHQLRALLDNELDLQTQQSAEAHLTDCPPCSRRLNQIRANAALVRDQLVYLAPEASLKFSPHEALERHTNRRKEPFTMKNLFKKPASIAAGLAILLAISLLFPPVRAMASDFLSLFRVQQVKVISFDPAMLGQLDQTLEGNSEQIHQIFEENIAKVQKGEFTQVENPQMAAELAGFTPRLPANNDVASLGVMSSQKYEITIDTELWNSVLTGLGYQGSAISADLNGQKITVDVPASVTAGIGDCESLSEGQVAKPDLARLGNCVLLIQMPGPVVQTPDRLDVPQLAESMLQILGMDPQEAREFSQNTDWATTLVLPIPSGEGITSQEVNVNGSTATLITHDTDAEYTLFWVLDGILYGILGSGDSQAAMDLGASLPD